MRCAYCHNPIPLPAPVLDVAPEDFCSQACETNAYAELRAEFDVDEERRMCQLEQAAERESEDRGFRSDPDFQRFIFDRVLARGAVPLASVRR